MSLHEEEICLTAAPDEMTQYDWFGQARIHEVAGKLKDALKAYEAAIEMDPEFAKAFKAAVKKE